MKNDLPIIKIRLETLQRVVDVFDDMDSFKMFINIDVYNDAVETCKIKETNE